MTVPWTLVATVLLVSLANLSLRRGMSGGGGGPTRLGLRAVALHALRSPYVVAGGILYAVSMVTWMLSLRTVPVSRAYPLYVGGSFTLVLLGAYLLLGERFSWRRLVGTTAILCGIVLEVVS